MVISDVEADILCSSWSDLVETNARSESESLKIKAQSGEFDSMKMKTQTKLLT